MPNKNLSPNQNGFLGGLIIQVKLVLRLMKDNRINPLLKLLPFLGVVYLIFPDLLLGPIDDAALLLGGSYLFVELCPAQIVAEHMQQLQFENRSKAKDKEIDENVIDGEFHDLDR